MHVECRYSVVTCAKYYICDAADMNVLIITFTFKTTLLYVHWQEKNALKTLKPVDSREEVL